MDDETRPPWSTRLLAELDANDTRARAVAEALTVEQLGWQPRPGSWSVGQCLEHLCEANEQYVKAMSAALDGKPESPVDEITPGWFGRWFLRTYIAPSPATKKAPAPKKIQPGSTVDPAILDRFLTSNEAARDLVRHAAAHDVNRIRFENPFLPLLRFTVGTGLEITSKHQQRHLGQAERVREASEFPDSPKPPDP